MGSREESGQGELPCPVHTVDFRPRTFSAHSGMSPLAEALGTQQVLFSLTWRRVADSSWILGECLRRWGQKHYGSQWNGLLPFWDESRILRQVGNRGGILHFLWSEFAGPRRARPYRRKGQILIGTFHASARRQPEVLKNNHSVHAVDWITLMSETQKEYFFSMGVPPERIRVILHGVRTDLFTPDELVERPDDKPLRGLLVGKTERDHAFMAKFLTRISPKILHLRVATIDEQKKNYDPVPNLTLLPKLGDDQLLREYQQADILFMPMFDCTANNVVLEAMSCGTPVMANRVGGMAEYASPEFNFLMDGKDVDEWVAMVEDLARNREVLRERRAGVRQWVLRFDWREVAKEYRHLYAEAWRQDGGKA